MKTYRVYYSYDIEIADDTEDYPIIKWKKDTFDIDFESGFDSGVAKEEINRIANSDCEKDEKVKYANYYRVELVD